ncbi:hypothetical protein GCM10011609_10440 [Lentzea pudingi]|uniref:Uncharacterized protein n=1 Tax=Lentzea pudingi TaxID=1789439 RepID=A0ABQ2HFB1_9PSEU|nr:hypothetical protein GCM10011609_10440 [Lentzea pudingi]
MRWKTKRPDGTVYSAASREAYRPSAEKRYRISVDEPVQTHSPTIRSGLESPAGGGPAHAGSEVGGGAGEVDDGGGGGANDPLHPARENAVKTAMNATRRRLGTNAMAATIRSTPRKRYQ